MKPTVIEIRIYPLVVAARIKKIAVLKAAANKYNMFKNETKIV